jgi:hypothetical protein
MHLNQKTIGLAVLLVSFLFLLSATSKEPLAMQFVVPIGRESIIVLNSPIIVKNDNFVLQGLGIGLTVYKANFTNQSIIVARGFSNITIRDLTLDGQIDVPSNTRGEGIRFESCDNVLVENVEVVNVDKAGVFARDTTNLEWSNIHTYHTWSGLVLESCVNGYVHDCTVDLTDGVGIYLTDSALTSIAANRNVTVHGNCVFHVGDTAIDVSVKNSTTKYSDAIHVLNNLVDGSNLQSHSQTPAGSGITVSRVINSEFNNNLVKNMVRPEGMAKGFWIGQMPNIIPLNTYVAYNTIINCTIPLASAGKLPSNNILGNIIG